LGPVYGLADKFYSLDANEEPLESFPCRGFVVDN
jgi:hypothetical protein